jgi:hypothetical protein
MTGAVQEDRHWFLEDNLTLLRFPSIVMFHFLEREFELLQLTV